jgi:hypothetical protein
MSQDDARFLQLVAMFQMAALQQMGKFVSPVTGEVERDLQQAKSSIDLIEMLAEKTKGNLTPGEKEFLDKILFELRMNYVDEVNRPAEKPEEKPQEGETPDREPEGGSGNGEDGAEPPGPDPEKDSPPANDP